MLGGPAPEGVSQNLFGNLNIVAQSHCVEFAKFKPPQQVNASSIPDFCHVASRGVILRYRPCALPDFALSRRTRSDRGKRERRAAAATVSLLRLAARDIFPAKEKGHDVHCDRWRHAAACAAILHHAGDGG